MGRELTGEAVRGEFSGELLGREFSGYLSLGGEFVGLLIAEEELSKEPSRVGEIAREPEGCDTTALGSGKAGRWLGSRKDGS